MFTRSQLLLLLAVGAAALSMLTLALVQLPAPSADFTLPTQASLNTAVPVIVANNPALAQPVVLPVGAATLDPVPTVLIPEPPPNQRVIQFQPGTSEAEQTAYLTQIGGTVSRRVEALNLVVVTLPDTQPLPVSPIVTLAEPDYYAVALQNPVDDPMYAQQWALPVIGAPAAWSASLAPVTIAVVDSGICAQHPDLTGRIVPGFDFILDQAGIPSDGFGHGCGVSGVIAANLNNGIGIAGAAPNATIMPLRVLNDQGQGSYSDIAAAMVYAADNGAHIINLSIGGTNDSAALRAAVDYAVARDVVVIAAAGNRGVEGAMYPAAYPPVIAVGSVDANLQRSSFSNYGPLIDVSAPGSGILTTRLNGDVGMSSGTSMAAPYVASVAALKLGQGQPFVVSGGIIHTGTSVVTAPPTVVPTPVPTSGPRLFSDTNTQGIYSVTTFGEERVRYVTVDFTILPPVGTTAQTVGPVVVFNLFNDLELRVVQERVEARTTGPGYTWIGRVEGNPFSTVILLVNNGQLEGHLNTADGSEYRIQTVGNGVHVVQQFDQSAFLMPHTAPTPPAPPAGSAEAAQLQAEAAAQWDAAAQISGMPVIDVMVVYTSELRSYVGTVERLNAQIELAIAETNLAYSDSEMPQRIRLVHTAEVNYRDEQNDGDGIDLERLTYRADSTVGGRRPDPNGFMDEVHNLRAQYGADIVTLLEIRSPFCGRGWVLNWNNIPNDPSLPPALQEPNDTDDVSFAPFAFNTVRYDCLLVGNTLAHELGHNLGSQHNREDANGAVAGSHIYNFGYRVNGSTPGTGFTTIMAYPNCATNQYCPRIPRFAVPSINHTSGQPIGVPFDGSPSGTANGADNQRGFGFTAAIVASFSAPATPVLISPVNGALLNQTNVPLTWQPYPDDDRYEIQISTTNTFTTGTTETFPSITTAYTFTAGADATYFWRVRVSRSDGNFGMYSTPRSFTIDRLAPTAPTLIAPAAAASVSERPTLTWSAVAGAVRYQVSVNPEGSVTNPPYTTTATTLALPGALPPGTYTWSVSALDAAGNAGVSETRTFTVRSGNASVPVLNAVSGSSVTLTWGGVSYAYQYELQVDNTNTFSSPEYNITAVPAASQEQTINDITPGVWYWRVRAQRSDGSYGPWSMPQTLVVEASN